MALKEKSERHLDPQITRGAIDIAAGKAAIPPSPRLFNLNFPSLVVRQHAEISLEKWPRAWRIFLLAGGAAAVWVAIITIVHWL